MKQEHAEFRVIVDAIVLAGGKSRRLDSYPKHELKDRGITLIGRAIDSAEVCRRTVVVGWIRPGLLPEHVLATVEDPRFGGPAAAVSAGLAALDAAESQAGDFTMVLASDMPRVGDAVRELFAHLHSGDAHDGVIAIEDGRAQPLAAIYRTAPLRTAAAAYGTHGGSMLRLISDLALDQVAVPDGATDDADTWDDVTRLGLTVDPTDTEAGHAAIRR